MQKTQTVQLPNGQQAPVLVADLNKDVKMAIISQNVLKYLVTLLPKASINDILDSMAGKLQALRLWKEVTIKDYVECLSDELEFHASVNLIKEFVDKDKPQEAVIEPTKKIFV